MIYHIKKKSKFDKKSEVIDVSSNREQIELIIFLNKTLAFVEIRYWSTELKMAALIWVVRKIRLLIMSFLHFVVVFTDHVANSIIINQIKFISSSVNKLNLKLIRVFIYLFQFRLRAFHRFDKFNVVFDVFNRLSTMRQKIFDVQINNFDINDFHTKKTRDSWHVDAIVFRISKQINEKIWEKFKLKANIEFVTKAAEIV